MLTPWLFLFLMISLCRSLKRSWALLGEKNGGNCNSKTVKSVTLLRKEASLIFFLFGWLCFGTILLYICMFHFLKRRIMQMPSKGDMIDLVNGLCLIQDRIHAEHCFDFIKEPKVANVEALKVPMFYVWHKLGYGLTYTLSPRGANAYWLASFKTSPAE